MKTTDKDKYKGVLETIAGGGTPEETAPQKKQLEKTLDPELQELLKQREIQKAVQAEATRQRQPHRTKKYDRTSLEIDPIVKEKLKELALRGNTTFKEVAMLAFTQAIERYEAKHGEIKPTEKPDISDILS